VLHLWTAGLARAAVTTEAVDRAFWSPACTLRACGRCGQAVRLLFVSEGALPVLPGDPVRADAALLAGPAGVGPREYTQLATRQVDIQASATASDPARTAQQLLAELADLGRADAVFAPVAWRGGQRWRRGFESAPLPAAALQLPERALVLVTGGLGGIGLALAQALASACASVRLILTGRSALPPAERWPALAGAATTEPRLARRLRALLALQAAGATLETAAVDVADEAAMAALLAGLCQRHGPLYGVVHAAGLPAGGVIELKTRAAADAILAPKVQGTRVLQRLLAGASAPTFVVLCSSLTATMTSAGQVDYTAANAFQDAAALELQAAGVTTAVAVQWDSWSESGMSVEAELPPALAELRRQSLVAGLTDAEGAEVFARVLAAGLAQLWVSTRELAERLAAPAGLAPGMPGGPGAAQSGDEPGASAASASPAADARAGLSAPYVAPRTETERLVASAWQDLFGIAQMGVHDNFFEADGHSLLAIQIVARIARDLGVRLPANALFELPTIERVAQRIDAERGASATSAADEGQLADALALVEQLSDDEVARLLAEDTAPR
jgi:NAD(P)-dependent dehydrogenase (short-subunit alcohol dehydrogenase family)/acyl carrier protein